MPTKPQGNDKAESADQKWKVRIEGTLTLIREGDSDSSETEHRDTIAHQSGDEEQRSPDVSRVRMLAKNVLGWLIAHATFINALFAAAIFFATCQYTVYSGRQWGAMQEANQTTRESLVSVQRAFVTFRGVEAVARTVDPVTNKATDVELATVWENSGTTPTKYMRINVNCVPRPDPLPEHFDFADVGKPEDRPVVIGPKATMLTGPSKKF